MNGIAVLQMLTFMKYENLERKWGNLGFKITENVLRLYLSLLWCSFSFLLIYEVIFCSFMESKSWHFFIHFFLTESRVLVALHCKVLSFLSLIGRTIYFHSCSLFWLVGCVFRKKFKRAFFFVSKSQYAWNKFTLCSHCLLLIFPFVLIGWGDYFKSSFNCSGEKSGGKVLVSHFPSVVSSIFFFAKFDGRKIVVCNLCSSRPSVIIFVTFCFSIFLFSWLIIITTFGFAHSSSEGNFASQHFLEISYEMYYFVFTENIGDSFLSVSWQNSNSAMEEYGSSFVSLPPQLSRDWPHGRFVWLAENRQCQIFINFEDHLKVVITQTGGDIQRAFRRYSEILSSIEEGLKRNEKKFMWSSKYGYLTSSPHNIGTGLEVEVEVRLSKLCKVGKFNFYKLIIVTRWESSGIWWEELDDISCGIPCASLLHRISRILVGQIKQTPSSVMLFL